MTMDPFKDEPPRFKITIREALAPLRRHLLATIAGFLVTFALVNAVAWWWAANYYAANMQVVVEQDRADPVVTAGQDSAVGGIKQITTDQVSSEVALLHGTDMLQSAVQTCGLVEPPQPSLFGDSSVAQAQAIRLATATAKLAKRLSVEAEPTSNVIEISYGHRGKPETPACVLEQLAQLYLDKHLHLRRSAGSSSMFADQTEKSKQALTESEARLVAFSRATGSGDPDALKFALAQQLAMTEAVYYRARETAFADKQRVQELKSQMQIIPRRSESSRQETAAYFLIQNLQGNLLTAEIKRSQLLLKYDHAFPLVKEADQEIEATRTALEQARQTTYMSETTDRDATFEFLRQELAKSETEIALANGSATALKKSISDMTGQMVKLEVLGVQKAALEREVKANESKYLLLFNKREQERIGDVLDQRRVANIAIAVRPAVPALPAHNPVLIVALGFLLSAAVALGAGYVAEYMDPFLRTPEDVGRDMGVPVLAVFSAQPA